ncbi:MAG: hypothetical protein JXB03_02955 [Spirochaetales bacterium]|nr:hypothetical protein [Spirochaetales bacterium]
MKKPRNLTSILSTAFFLLTVLALTVPSIMNTFTSYTTHQSIVEANLQLTAEKAAVELGSYVQQMIRTVENAAWFGDITSASGSEQKIFLSRVIGKYPEIRKAALYNQKGDRISYLSHLGSTEELPLPENLAAIHTPAESPATGTARISSLRLDKESNEPRVIITVPLFDRLRQASGLVSAELSLRFMWNLVDAMKLENDGIAFIADHRGAVIAHPNIIKVIAGTSVSQSRIMKHITESRNTNSGFLKRYTGIQGIPVAGLFVFVENTDWVIITEIPWNSTYRKVINQALLALFITFVTALLAGTVGIFLSKRIADPISALTRTITQTTRETSFFHTDVTGPEEVQVLSKAFNNMTARLHDAITELEHQIEENQQTHRELKEANQELKKSLKEKTVFLKEIHHRVKNNLQIISSLLELQSSDIENTEFKQIFTVSQRRIASMTSIHEQLYMSEDFTRINFGEYTKLLTESLLHTYLGDNAAVVIKVFGEDFYLSLDSAVPCGLILNELVTNSLKYAFPGRTGTISIELTKESLRRTITIRDDGTGYSTEDRDKKSRSLGLTLVHELVRQLHGTVSIHSTRGTETVITFSEPTES